MKNPAPSHAPDIVDINGAASAQVDALVKMARLAIWAVERERLSQVAPDLVLQARLGERFQWTSRSWGRSKPDEYAKAMAEALEKIWPVDQIVTENPKFEPVNGLDGVRRFDVYASSFSREQSIYRDQAAFVLYEEHIEDSGETWTDEDGNEYDEEGSNMTENVLAIVSPRVVIQSRVNSGPYCDEDFDAELEASIYVSEDATQMQKLIRTLAQQHFYDRNSVFDQDELDDHLRRCFGEAYVPADDLAVQRRMTAPGA